MVPHVRRYDDGVLPAFTATVILAVTVPTRCPDFHRQMPWFRDSGHGPASRARIDCA
jgi:hypothetical protein